MNLFDSGIRPVIDDYLLKRAAEVRDYGDYWSASSAGYCMRKLMFERLGVPPVVKESDARKARVFEAGHVFHRFVQDITKNAGLSVAQELELSDNGIMVRGHIDDLVLVEGRLILYDYKTQHANAFTWQKGRPPSHYHKMQVGTYIYMLRRGGHLDYMQDAETEISIAKADFQNLSEARILKISKDDLRLDENQILWTPDLEKEVVGYWNTLNGYWRDKSLPRCTCDEYEGGFMAKEKFNPFFYDGKPCSLEYFKQWKLSKEVQNELSS